jgi:hypothetical protein
MSPNAQEPLDPASRPLPAAATIAVAGLSAALVIAVGVLIAERVVPRRSAMPLAATPLPSMALPVEDSGRAAAIVAPATIASAAPVATVASAAPIVAAATIASAAPVAPAASAAPIVAAATIASTAPVASAAAPAGDPAGLPADRGYLVLGGAAGARAYVNGADVGAAEERIAVPCGARYVRLGTVAEKGKPPSWVTAGRSVVVACRGETRVELKP